tara:strand:+ start:74 stop:202 length:129 start_codon:yes stop_codon:yes gene_type:complete
MKYHTVIFALLVGASYQISLKEFSVGKLHGPPAELDEDEMDR